MTDQKLVQKIQDGTEDVSREEIEKRIRLIAYGIWEEEGRPHGRHAHHWQEAERRARDYSARSGDRAANSDPNEERRDFAPDEPKDESDMTPTTGADSTARPRTRSARTRRAPVKKA